MLEGDNRVNIRLICDTRTHAPLFRYLGPGDLSQQRDGRPQDSAACDERTRAVPTMAGATATGPRRGGEEANSRGRCPGNEEERTSRGRRGGAGSGTGQQRERGRK